jgi:hypothetical protein
MISKGQLSLQFIELLLADKRVDLLSFVLGDVSIPIGDTESPNKKIL